MAREILASTILALLALRARVIPTDTTGCGFLCHDRPLHQLTDHYSTGVISFNSARLAAQCLENACHHSISVCGAESSWLRSSGVGMNNNKSRNTGKGKPHIKCIVRYQIRYPTRTVP
jgi:hypothetical protein